MDLLQSGRPIPADLEVQDSNLGLRDRDLGIDEVVVTVEELFGHVLGLFGVVDEFDTALEASLLDVAHSTTAAENLGLDDAASWDFAGNLVSLLKPFVTSRKWLRYDEVESLAAATVINKEIIAHGDLLGEVYKIAPNLSLTKSKVKAAFVELLSQHDWIEED